MIFAKIDPVASVVKQNGPFSTTTVTGSYMTAYARPYGLGADQVRFQVTFGNVTFDESGSVKSFSSIIDSQVTMTSEELANWGTDDTVVLSDLATKQNLSVLEFVSGSINSRGEF